MWQPSYIFPPRRETAWTGGAEEEALPGEEGRSVCRVERESLVAWMLEVAGDLAGCGSMWKGGSGKVGGCVE